MKTMDRSCLSDIAVIGMSCRFPGAENYQQYWQNLVNGVNSIREITPDRWDINQYYSPDINEPNKSVSKWGGLLEDIASFDASFFNISPREAQNMDPQQRLLLQEVWHCIEDAGVLVSRLQQHNTSVCVGVMAIDYQQMLATTSEVDSYACLGNYEGILANRISYYFGLNGESKTLDTACSSSLVAMHDARRILLLGESDYAFAAGVSIICHPWRYISFSKSRMLSPDGQCKTFDKEANGYVPGEGVGVLLLTTLDRALAGGHRIHAIIKGSAVNHSGNSQSITAPRVAAQTEVIIAAQHAANVTPEMITYLEAHGTGTSLGDPIEIESLTCAFQENTDKTQYCAIGSVKTNIGHLEAAAGIAGVIKVILMMQHQKIVPTLNVNMVNPLIDFENSPFYLARQYQDWKITHSVRRYAGISSFGFGGVNSHVILEEYTEPLQNKDKVKSSFGYPFVLSAKTPESLQTLVKQWQKFVKTEAFEQLNLADISFTLVQGRASLAYRRALWVFSSEDLAAQLQALDNALEPTKHTAGILLLNSTLKVTTQEFMRLCEQYSLLQKHFDNCCAVLKQLKRTQLIKQIRSHSLKESLKSLFTGVVLYCWGNFLLELGLKPKLIKGEGVGYVIAAALSGYINLTDALKIILGEDVEASITFQVPQFSFYDHFLQRVVSAVTIKSDDCMRLREQLVLDSSLLKQLKAKATLLRENQFTFKQYLEEWDIALQETQGISLDSLWNRTDKGNVQIHTNESLLLQLILFTCLKKLQDKWQLKDKKIVFSPLLLGLVKLLLTKAVSYHLIIRWVLENDEVNNVQFSEKIQAIKQKDIPEQLLDYFQTRKVVSTLPIGDWLQGTISTNEEGQRLLEQKEQPLLDILIGEQTNKENNSEMPVLRIASIENFSSKILDLWSLNLLTKELPDIFVFPGRVITLFLYPFSNSRYWIETNDYKTKGTTQILTALHPLIDVNISTLTMQCFRKVFSGTEFFLKDHIIQGQKVLPGVVYVEMARAAGELAVTGEEVAGLRQLVWMQPISVTDQKCPITIKLIQEEQEVHFEIISHIGNNLETIVHAKGKLQFGNLIQTKEDNAVIGIEAIKQRFSVKKEKLAIYNQLGMLGFDYGPGFQVIDELYCNENEALGIIVFPKHLESDISLYNLHPSLMDGALQTCMALLAQTTSHIHLPFSLGEVKFIKALPERCYAFVSRTHATVPTFTIRLLDQAGETLVIMKDFVARALSHRQEINENEELQQYMNVELQNATEIDYSELQEKLAVYLKEIIARSTKLPFDKIELHESFANYGVDSIMVMELNVVLDEHFGELPATLFFEYPTLQALIEYFISQHKVALVNMFSSDAKSGDANQVYDANEGIILSRDLENKFQSFPLTDTQEAFLAGRYISFHGDYAGCHLYLEYEKHNLHIPRLNQAWEKLILRHEMLRTVISLEGKQCILENIPTYSFAVHLHQDSSATELSDHLQQVRRRMSHKIYQPSEYPLFEIEITACQDNRYIIHFSIDELIVDALSIFLLLAEWAQLYENPDLSLPPLEISFRDYVMALKVFETSKSYQESLSYWLKSLNNLPGDPLLANAKIISQLGDKQTIERRTLNYTLPTEKWLKIKNKAKAHHLSPSTLLVTLFIEILAIWSEEEAFSIILTTLNRPVNLPLIKQLIGPLTSTLLFIREKSTANNLLEHAVNNQRQIVSGLLHSYHVSGIRVLRELKVRKQVPSSFSLGIVFTSMIIDSFSEIMARQADNWYQDASYRVMQTPQIYLEHHVWEDEDTLHFTWYVMEALFDHELLQNIFNSYCAALIALADDQISLEKDLMQNNKHDTKQSSYFMTTDLQQAYLVGRTDKLQNGKLGCTNYQEFVIKNINVSKLNLAWQQLINIHEMLRSIITQDGRQKILAEAPIYNIEVYDLRHHEKKIQTEKLEEIRDRILREVFLADNWPYFSLKISLLDDLVAILHINVDLIIADGASVVELLYRQLIQLYLNPDKILIKPAYGFRDYIEYLNNYSQSSDYQISMDYWQQKMTNIPAGPSLLSCDLIDINHVFKRKRLTKTLKGWSLLKQKAASLNISPDFVLLTAFAEALKKCCKEDSFAIVVVGWDRLPVHPEINSVVGEFICLSWLTVYTNANLSFAEKLLNYYEQVSQDRKHQAVSGLKALRRAAVRSGKLLTFPAVYTGILNQVGGDGIEQTYGLSQTPQVSLDCISFDDCDVIHLHWDILIGLLPSGVFETMFDTYCGLLEQLSNNEDNWNISTTNLTSNLDTQPILTDELLHSDFIKQAQYNPELIAIFASERQITYKTLYEFAVALAAELQQQQSDRTRPIGILMEKGWEQVVAALGTLFANFIFLPIDPTNPPQRITYIVDNAQVDIILTQNKLINDLQFLSGKKLIVVSERLLETFIPMFQRQTLARADDLAYIIYTSGSTGTPKGVMISHKGARNTILDINQRFSVNKMDKVFAISALSFDLSIYDIFGTLAAGAAIVIPDANFLREPSYWAQALRDYQVTIWNSTPALMQMLVMYAGGASNIIPQSLRLVLLSGDRIPNKLPFQLKNFIPYVAVISLGGATEASIWSIIHPITEDDANKPNIPYGKAMVNQTMQVLDQNLDPCPVKTEGEIYIGGVGLARGYLNDAEKTAKSFIQHPKSGERLYKTGDIGYYDDDGEIIFVGRIDSQVKVRGFRIELGEIQVALLEHPAIREAIVCIKDELSGDPKLVAYLITTLTLTKFELAKELQGFLKQKLPPYMIPAIYISLSEIPITGNGKVDYKALPWPGEAKETIVQDIGNIEAKLEEIFKEVLRITHIQTTDDLFTLGASSLNMVIAAERIKVTFGVVIPIQVLIGAPTIFGIAKYVADNQKKNEVPEQVSSKVKIVKEKFPNTINISDQSIGIELPKVRIDINDYYRRASQYQFLSRQISFSNFANFIGLLKQEIINNETKYLYPSAGKSYAVQTYFYIKEGAVENLTAGLYYYHPIKHKLYFVSASTFNSEHHYLYNRDHFEKASFAVYFVAQLNTITPTYGAELAKKMVLLEVGHICQLLMLRQADYNIGLCSIGDVDFEKIRDAFELVEGQVFIHSMLGGYINYGLEEKSKIAIVGVSGRYPGAKNVDEYWDNLKIAKKVISQFPNERVRNDLQEGNKNIQKERWGGFLENINQFDNLLFHISPVEARGIDPQERLFLEVVWECLESAGYTNDRLNQVADKVGVFVGVMWSDYQASSIENRQNNNIVEGGSLHSSIANRVSHYFNFKGPSVAVDTSCSSSLTALHLACQSIKRGECRAAIVGGVNLVSHPYHHDLLLNLGLITNEDKSYAFSGDGSGWIVGEGVGAILILPRELAEKNHDYIYALVKGTAINHIGNSTRYGMPNIDSQAASIQSVLLSANCSPQEINYIETAATGANIADAAEVAALKQVFSHLNRDMLPIGTVKSTIGHLESASGLSQLTKVILQLKYKKIVPTLIEGKINSLLELEKSLFYIPDMLSDWKSKDNSPLITLINAFGATGNCAHAIIEEYLAPSLPNEVQQSVIIVLSAATPTQLKEYAQRLHTFLINKDSHFSNQQQTLTQIAYTLQVGRRDMVQRLAIVVNDLNDLIVKLNLYLTGHVNSREIFVGSAEQATLETTWANQQASLTIIASDWVKGASVHWEQLYQKQMIRKIPLPTYPFARESHWLESAPKSVMAPVLNNNMTMHSTKDAGNDILLFTKTTNYLKTIFFEESEIAIDKINTAVALENYGINSLLITKLNQRLEKDFGELSKTLFFEYKTLNELAQFFVKHYQEKLSAIFNLNQPVSSPNVNSSYMSIPTSVIHNSQIPQSQDIAIIGISGRYPQASNLEQFWENLKNAKDCITEIPAERWDNEFYHDLVKNKFGPETVYSKWGGFVKDIDKFDPLFFNTSPQDAEFMDPQERVFLEVVWEALEDAGYTTEILKNHFNNNVGVYAGAMYNEYQFYGAQVSAVGNPTALSPANGLIANRISYFLNLHGPSITLDTMCSSSLTSIHLAVNSLRQGECHLAIAGGINLILHPYRYIVQAYMNMSDSDGRCKSFGEGGNGFVPGEGAGAVLLKPLSTALQDGDRIYGVIKSSAINHCGKTNGRGVPDPVAQGQLIASVLSQANVDPRTISYIEAHGTGTALGDPIEITGLMRGFGLNEIDKQFCAIGSVKSNIGHLESAAGIAGLTKVLLQLKHKQLAPSLHSNKLNPNINFKQTPFYVQRELTEWNSISGFPRRAGISAFGAGGSNAHILIEESPFKVESHDQIKPYYLLTLSARHSDSLKQRIIDLNHYLQKHPELSLEGIAYTLNRGRNHFEYRCALVAASIEELKQMLVQIQSGQYPQNYLFTDSVEKQKLEPLFEELLIKLLHDLQNYQTLPLTAYKKKLLALADLYVKGYDLDWQLLHQGEAKQIHSLPTYPFLRNRYWFSELGPNAPIKQLHPLVGKNVSTLTEYCFKTFFRGNEFYLTDHLVGGNKVLPGVVYLEMARAVGELALPNNSVVKLEDTTWEKPLVVGDKGIEVSIRLRVVEKVIHYSVHSVQKGQEIQHAQGQLIYADLTAFQEQEQVQVNVNELERQLLHHFTKNDFYQEFARLGIEYGQTFQAIEWIKSGDEDILGYYRLPDKLNKENEYKLHPSIIDAALQSSFAFHLAANNQPTQLSLPVALEKLTIVHPLSREGYIHVKRKRENKDSLTFQILNRGGQLCVELHDLSLHVVSSEIQTPKLFYYQPHWESVPLSMPVELANVIQSLYVFTDDKTLLTELRKQLPSVSIFQLQTGPSYSQVEQYTYQVRQGEVTDYRQFITNLQQQGKVLKYFIFARNLTHVLNPIIYVDTILREIVLFVQTLMQVNVEGDFHFIVPYLYTDGLLPIDAMLTGFAKSLFRENSRYQLQLLGLDASAALSTQIMQLIAELKQSQVFHIRYQKNHRLIERYIPLVDAMNSFAQIPLRYEGVYLITGGLGEIGFIIAKYLATEFKAKLILTGRSQLSIDKQVKLEKLKELGAIVVYLSGDVSDKLIVEDWIKEAKTQFNCIHGIIHCAGILNDSLLLQKDWFSFQAVLAPKIMGAFHLDTLTQHEKLDCFVLFSSLVSCFGNAGQTDYAIANAFLDQLAIWRESLCKQGKRHGISLSINWPYWAEGGMEIDSTVERYMTQHWGMLPLPSESGIKAFVENLTPSRSQTLVLYGLSNQIAKTINSQENFLETANPVQNVSVDEKPLFDKTQAYLKTKLASLLKISEDMFDVNTSFDRYGFDSLMIINANRELAKDFEGLSVNLFLEHNTVTKLARYLTQTQESFPLTDMQHAYLVGRTNHFELGGVAGHAYIELEIKNLNLIAFNQAWQQLILRHPMLRVVVLEDGLQQILTRVPLFEVELADISNVNSKEQQLSLSQYRKEVQRSKLNPSKWPLFACKAFYRGNEEYTVSFYLDLLIIDGRSVKNLFNELFYFYKNTGVNLPPIEFNFKDYQTAYRALKQSTSYEIAKNYWLARIEKLAAAPQLPTLKLDDNSHPGFKRVTIQLARERWQKLQATAWSHRISPPAALCTLYATILSFWSKDPKFSMVVMSTKREPFHAQVDQIIANFSSTLILDIDLSEKLNFAEQATKIYNQLLQDMEHYLFNGVELLHELNKRKGYGAKPAIPIVFNSMLSANNVINTSPRQMDQFKDVDLTNFKSYMETPQVAIDHQLMEDYEGNLVVNWDYVQNHFANDVIEPMIEVYQNLLFRLADESNYWLKSISLMEFIPLHYFKKINETNNTAVSSENDLLYTAFIENMNNYPNKTALITSQKQMSYNELYRYATCLAEKLTNVDRNKPIAVVMEKGWEPLVALLSIMFVGAVYLPIDPELPKDRISYMLDNAAVEVILTQATLKNKLKFLKNKKIIYVNGSIFQENIYSFEINKNVTPDDLAYIIYTSGSTGLPKGVMVSHKAALNTILDINKRFHVCNKDRIFAVSSLSFDLSIYDIFGTLAAGATIVIPDAKHEKDPAHWIEMLNKHKVTIWNSAPALMQMLVAYVAERSHIITSALRLILLSGDWIPVNLPNQLMQLIKNVKVISLGGATEAAIWSILHEINNNDDANRVSVPYGKPMSNQKFYVFDHQLVLRPAWVVGELYIGGIGLAEGYLNDLEKTSKSFIRHPDTGERLYRTGDLGYYEPDGKIIFLGRTDSQIKIRGHRVELLEVELALLAHPVVDEAVVTYQAEQQAIIGYVHFKQGSISDKALKEFLSQKLPNYMMPAVIVTMESFPLNNNGKIDRKSLPLPVIKHSIKPTYILPRNEIENQLATLWQKHLGVGQFSIQDNFFTVGGDSFKAVLLMADIYKIYGKEISISILLSSEGTIENLAKIIEDTKSYKKNFNFLIKINQVEIGQPIFFVHPVGGSALCYRSLATKLEPDHPFYGLQLIDFVAKKIRLPSSMEEMGHLYLNEIQQINPQGPYFLGGWSMGGVVAYEIGRQLEAQGKKVAWVAMIDSPLPRYQQLRRRDLLVWFFSDLLQNTLVEGQGESLHSLLEAIKPEDKLETVINALRQAQLLPLMLSEKKVKELFKLFKTNYQILNDYQPSPSRLSLIKFKATKKLITSYYVDHPHKESDCWGWSSINGTRIETHSIKGDHYSIISQPDEVVKLLRDYF